MMKKIFILIVFISLLLFSAQSVSATNISIDTPASINEGDSLDVAINANTDGVLINSIELVIEYNQDLLSFVGYSDDNAVVKLWIDPPHFAENLLKSETGKIYLSGIIPGGVLGLYDAKKKGLSPIPLVHLFFTAKEDGNAKFSFIASKILKHDGKGTPLPHDALGSQVVIKNNPNKNNLNNAEDQKNKQAVDDDLAPNSLNSTFWITLFIVISGIIVYKLLKYKYGKLSE